MCFMFRKNAVLCVAQKDIVCYKIVERKRWGARILYKSSLQHVPYKFNQLYEKKGKELEEFFEFQGTSHSSGNGEGFHSYVKFKEVKEQVQTEMDKEYYVDIAVECIIPKGAYFYKSEGNYEYFSSAIMIVGLIPEGYTPKYEDTQYVKPRARSKKVLC